MNKVTPYKTKRNAMKALDNGGRFFNLLTHADDGEIQSAELARLAGAFSDRQKMVLHLEMALADLEPQRAREVRHCLSDRLKQAHKKYLPAVLAPARANRDSKPGDAVIVTGFPIRVTSKTQIGGFITVPIMAGSVTTFTLIPIMDMYDVYEVRSAESDECFLIAHTRGEKKLAGVPTRFGGIVKTLESKEGKKKRGGKYLEALYYTPLD